MTSQTEPGLCAFNPLVHIIWKGWLGWHESYHLFTASNPNSLFTGCPDKCRQLLQSPPRALHAPPYASSTTRDSPHPAPSSYLQSPSRLVVPSGIRRYAIRITQNHVTQHSIVYSVYFPHYICLPSGWVWLLWVLYLTDFCKLHAQHMKHGLCLMTEW